MSPAAPGAPALPALTLATMKLHMLHELEPATEITGRAWRACLPYPRPSPPAHARAGERCHRRRLARPLALP